MINKSLKITVGIFLLFASFFLSPLKSKEIKELSDPHEYNFFTGMFDFSDDGKKSTLIGVQHQNENLYRDSFLGTISPVSGF